MPMDTTLPHYPSSFESCKKVLIISFYFFLENAHRKIVETSTTLFLEVQMGFGYKYFTVNHSENFVDPITGSHTNTVERSWREVRFHVPRYSKTESILRRTWQNFNSNGDIWISQSGSRSKKCSYIDVIVT